MTKYKIFELAKEFNTESSLILAMLSDNNIHVENYRSSVGEEERTLIKDFFDVDNIPISYRNISAREMGYKNNKDVTFKYLSSIFIKHFRSFRQREIKLGRYITIITGKNGTMKSSLLGLIAHPFSSINDAVDLYGNPLKTEMRNVFKLSLEKDTEQYKYYLKALTSDDKEISEPIRVYKTRNQDGSYRHRITVGKDNSSGLGNFSLNTSYMNLKRLFPIIDTEATRVSDNLSEEEHLFISKAYSRIMQRDEFKLFETISDNKEKNTCGPKDSFYDYTSISSGEDNLGALLYKLIAFQRNSSANKEILQGIFCIDELEASLHPVAQKNLLNFLYYWAEEHNIQIIITTHSLYLIEQYMKLQKKKSKGMATLINISTQMVGPSMNYNIMTNPEYKIIYKELTYDTIAEEDLYKVHIMCEDNVAETFIKRILSSQKILKNIDFITNLYGDPGTSCKSYFSLIKNGPKLLSDSIVILDPDIPEKNIQRANFPYLKKLPDPDNVPIEKRIAKYVYELDGDDDLFEKREHMARQSDMLEFHIDFNSFGTSMNIKPYKDWATSDSNFFRKALTRYVKDNAEYFATFKTEIISLINDRRINNGLPKLEL